MSKEGSPEPPAGSGSTPVAELKALLKDSLVEILRENPSLVRRTQDLDNALDKPHVSVLFYGSLVFTCCYMIRVLPVWERRSGAQAGGGPCLLGVSCLLPMMPIAPDQGFSLILWSCRKVPHSCHWCNIKRGTAAWLTVSSVTLISWILHSWVLCLLYLHLPSFEHFVSYLYLCVLLIIILCDI